MHATQKNDLWGVSGKFWHTADAVYNTDCTLGGKNAAWGTEYGTLKSEHHLQHQEIFLAVLHAEKGPESG